MANTVKIVIVNETDFGFAATGEDGDFVMDNGTLAPGSGLPPPVLEPKKTCDFTVMTPLSDPEPKDQSGPEGTIEQLFGVKVTGVWTLNVRGKEKRMGKTVGRRPNWKKAIVKLREGDTIEIFEG